MKNYIIALIVTIIAFFISNNYVPEVVTENNNGIKELKIDENIENYVLGVIACEMPALFEEEALKANAIAARTFVMYKINLDENYNPYKSTEQCYITTEEMRIKWENNFDKYYNKMKSIVKDTEGIIMTYNTEPIKAYYFATSNGKTENVQTVFNENREYIASVNSEWDKNVSGYEKTITINEQEMLKKLSLNDKKINNIKILEKNETNHVSSISINNKIYKGTEFRKLLSLRSTDFEIEKNEDIIKITTRGYGHGVGMSQTGANEMAKLGHTYEEILNHYYKNIEIKTYNL